MIVLHSNAENLSYTVKQFWKGFYIPVAGKRERDIFFPRPEL
jgi:hypothetical protein